MTPTSTHSLPELLYALRRKINERARASDLKYDLTGSQIDVLWFISLEGKRTMESIAGYLGIKPPSVTALIDRMEKEGYVAREKDPTDRRVVHIVLTEKTKKQFAALKVQKESLFTELTSKLTPKDKKDLERILLLLIED